MKLYEITVSFCVYADNQEEAFEKASEMTEDFVEEKIKYRVIKGEPHYRDMEFFYIDEPQEVKV
jgi:hypothetical protein